MSEQFDLFEWVMDMDTKKKPEERVMQHGMITNWSYGVVQLENGDLLLAEIYWDENDQPVGYCEPHLTVDPEEGVKGLIKSLQDAVLDLTEDPHPIPVSLFYTDGDND